MKRITFFLFAISDQITWLWRCFKVPRKQRVWIRDGLIAHGWNLRAQRKNDITAKFDLEEINSVLQTLFFDDWAASVEIKMFNSKADNPKAKT